VQTEWPLSDLFLQRTVEAVPETPVVLTELTISEDAPLGILMQMLFIRDLGFLA